MTIESSEEGNVERGSNVKHLSEKLAELASGVETLEESAKAAAEKNRRQLEARRQALIEKLGEMGEEWEAAKPEAEFSVKRWWAEAKGSLDDALAVDTRADFEVRSGDLRMQTPVRTAEEAESAAETAVALATYYLILAEWAVVDAALAQPEAEVQTEED